MTQDTDQKDPNGNVIARLISPSDDAAQAFVTGLELRYDMAAIVVRAETDGRYMKAVNAVCRTKERAIRLHSEISSFLYNREPARVLDDLAGFEGQSVKLTLRRCPRKHNTLERTIDVVGTESDGSEVTASIRPHTLVEQLGRLKEISDSLTD